MGNKNKLKRFEDIARFENVFEYTDFGDKPTPKGKWHKEIFENENPIVLELACGKAEYTIYLAEKNPDKNYIGIDLKGNRIWKGASYALQNGMNHVRFIRMLIDHLPDYFEKGEVDEIWITFPDPHLRESRSRQRLTSPKFLNIYRKLLNPGSSIHLKTDSDLLYEFTLETIKEERCEIIKKVDDIYKEEPGNELLTHQTFYEKKHLKAGKTIHYIAFRLSE
ncbi:tRNA (guanosine(46)-N7)-methyltransferase TrmB [Rhodohalobacter sp. 614A]|uniref:tRNA (guanosine(46)-N7)-methyltransferase TrmB n=1 Tax=Rhodohalobacter sp. 614A TaxID=2908649 RepID=UPI001F1C70E7|nr:tRNA (guanosine(46)-N7)-methyltransferase TrmB [Rhodohalobacter sp. 614A]